MRKIVRIAFAAVAASALFVTAVAASASTQGPASQVRLTGVGFSSLGTGPAGATPGIESATLANYSYSPKNLKGYRLTDRAGNVVWLCDDDAFQSCTSTTADHDRAADVAAYTGEGTAPVIPNASDADAWITLPARSQVAVNVEGRNDGPWLNNGGDTVYLRNSVGRVLTQFGYAVSNPTS